MVVDCPNCGLHFERIEGHWLGAVATNTIMSAIVVMATIVIALIVTLPTPRASHCCSSQRP